MTAPPVVIFGTGDFARVAAQYLAADSPHRIVAFTIDERHMPARGTMCGLPVVAFEHLEDTHPPDVYAIFVAVDYTGVDRARAETVAEFGARGYRLISYINSAATLWSKTIIGANSFVLEHNVIQPFVTIGDNVILWSGNHIGPGVSIGDHAFVASHAVIAGNCAIGAYSFVGDNATIRDGVRIAARCIIGAGAVIAHDTEEGDVFAVDSVRLSPRRSWEHVA